MGPGKGLFANGLFLLLRRLPGGSMDEGKFREPAFCVAPRTANMHNATSERINGSQPHDACGRHARWARPLRQSRVLRGTNIFTLNWEPADLSCAVAQISHFSPSRRNHFGVFGKGVRGEPRETAGLRKGFPPGIPPFLGSGASGPAGYAASSERAATVDGGGISAGWIKDKRKIKMPNTKYESANW